MVNFLLGTNKMLSEPIQVTLLVTKVFDQINIPYLVGGSLASAVHGVVRATLDADIIADINQEQVNELIKQLQAAFYIDEEMVRNAIKERGSFNIIHLDTMFKVDIFLLKKRAFDQNQMERRVLQTLGPEQAEKAYVSTVEDIILAKLEWFRSGGEISDRQWRDILGVLQIQWDRINFSDLQKWAKSLGVSDLLERARNEAKPS